MKGKIERRFVDWRQPALAAAAELLRERYQRGRQLDLSGLMVVVPGSRAGRRLVEILVSMCAEQRLKLRPPEIVTPEAFPEKLYRAQRPFANDLTQKLAWVQALRQAKRGSLAGFLPHPPAFDDIPRWLAIAETLRRLHLELAADRLDCQQVLERAAKLPGFGEQARWRALSTLQRSYLDVLDGLGLWDAQTARLVAVERREIRSDRPIVLLDTVDLSQVQRSMLEQIATQVTAIVLAPADLANRFDEYGCLLPEAWIDSELPLADDQIRQVDGPADQAAAVAQWLGDLQGKYRADQIAICVPDEKLVPHVERQLTQDGLTGRWAIGKLVGETGPYRLLNAVANYASGDRFRDLTALVRHPDVFDWLEDQLTSQGTRIDVLDVLDSYAEEHFPATLDHERLKGDARHETLLAVQSAVEALVAPLKPPSLKGKPQLLAKWAEALRDILVTVYGQRLLNRTELTERYLEHSLSTIARALDDLATAPEPLQPMVDARQACRMVLAAVGKEGIAPPANPEAIELLGWLDLALDDAPAAIVTSFNEGFVPSSVTADAWLPNRLRQSLGLLHNDRRLARDAYALAALCASRQALRLIVAKRDGDANPLTPSRLLFLCPPEQLVRRAKALFGDLPPQPPRRRLLGQDSQPTRTTAIVRPRPQVLAAPLLELSVTRFRDYLACPYRFYLRHLLKLTPVEDDAAELDGGAFGGMVHWVLEQFGRAEEAKDLRNSATAERISEYLDDKLDQFAAGRFGKQGARAAVLVQLEQARLRLRAFASWQAARRAAGWRIVFSEDSEKREVLAANFPVDGKPFNLLGRIDRVDYHDSSRRLAVLDYKTADRGDDPEKTHRAGGQWIDLQLPLYRKLVRELKLDHTVAQNSGIDLGYIVLPVDLNDVGLKLADWNETVLLTADQKAEEVIRHLRAQRFWPPTSPPPDFFDDVAVICQDRRMGGLAVEDEAA